ncbi:hypothetical protein D9M68_154460 [compost metagenome]
MKPFERFLGSEADIVERQTIFPINKRLLSPEDAARVKEHFLGEPLHGLPALVGTGGPNSGWATFHAAYCDECVKEDVTPLGESFWRRDHHVPGILFCGKHARPLMTPCQSCAEPGWGTVLSSPIRRCGCRPRTIATSFQMKDPTLGVELELANAASRLLDVSYMPHLGAEQIASLTRHGAIQRGILKDGWICRSTLDDFAREMSCSGASERVNFEGVARETLTAALRGRAVLRQPMRAILLLRSLYGDWSEVEEAAQNPAHLAIGPEPNVRRKLGAGTRNHGSLERARERYGPDAQELYAMYLNARKENQGASRAQIRRMLPWVAPYLLTEEQYEAADRESLGDIEALDASMTAHISTMAAILKHRNAPKRITPVLLLEGLPLACAWVRIRKYLPVASVAMRSCAERNIQFQRRLRAIRSADAKDSAHANN